jgi:hypothetical protein
MCDPVSASIAAVSAVVSIGGTIMSSQAQQKAANAIQEQNFATQQAQNTAFNQRIGAASRQTDAQSAVMQQTMADRASATADMRQAQSSAQQRQQDILNAENTQQESLRAAGDTQAQDLLARTNATQLAQGQQDYQNRANLLLDQATPQGPQPSDPQGSGDAATKGALTRRLAEAATNVRSYGSKVAALGAYNQPIQDINLAIAGNQYGIMPAQSAEKLLRAGASTRLLPSQVAYRNAGDLGGAMDEILRSRGQSGLDTAALSYGNAVSTANLGQSDADTIAANRAAQAKADAAYQQSLGGIVSGVGQLGLYGAGYYGSHPGFLNPKT